MRRTLSPLPTSKKLARWARHGLVAAVVLMGVALVVTVWSTNRNVERASDVLLAGQAGVFDSTLRARFRSGATPEVLSEAIELHASDGLRYVASYDLDGNLKAEAGTPTGTPEERREAVLEARSHQPVRVGAIARAVRGPRSAEARERARAKGYGMVLVEFTPTIADSLETSARRNLLVGAVGAASLLLIAFALVRWFLRRETLERELAHERRLASLGEMSAVLAHEIRNPIASLKGNAQLLVKMLPAEDKPRAKAERVVSESVRLESLTNDLLEFARTGELHRQPTDPASLLDSAARAQPAGRVEVDTSAAPTSWPLDDARMQQVLTNLLGNACEASTDPVHATVREERGRLVFTVRDHGEGIDPADLDKIFEPFFTRRTQGTGLGLAVSRRIVELHDGTLSAANAPDGGAVFRVVIPRG